VIKQQTAYKTNHLRQKLLKKSLRVKSAEENSREQENQDDKKGRRRKVDKREFREGNARFCLGIKLCLQSFRFNFTMLRRSKLHLKSSRRFSDPITARMTSHSFLQAEESFFLVSKTILQDDRSCRPFDVGGIMLVV